MTLTLTLTNVADLENGESTQLHLDRHGAIIGRSPHSDWSLPDPKNYVSSTHCEIDYRAGEYVLIDKSTNGTFLNGAKERMSGAHVLRDGDVIGIGHYRVGVSGGAARTGAPVASVGTSAPAAAGGSGWAGWSSDPSGAPAPAAAASAGWDSAPSGWDRKPEPSGGSGWASEVAPTQAAEAGWATPPASGEAASGWGAADTRASSEWNAVDAGAPAPSAGWGATPSPSQGRWQDPVATAPAAPSPVAPPPGDSVWGQKGAGPAAPAASGWDAIAPARDTAQEKDGGWTAGGGAITGRGAMAQHWAAPRIDAPEPAAPATEAVDVWGAMAASNTVDWSRGGFGAPLPSASPAPAPPAAPTADAQAWTALLAAAGVSKDALNVAPEQAAATAGAILKRLVAGLVVMMEARARAKAQLGAQSTTLELKGNNPIKFARSPERVLAQLLNPPERGFMGAADAVEDSFRDLQAHQMATLAAMQGALRATLDRFSPEAIRKRAEMRGVLARILPGARNATLWEAYEREFEGVAKGSDEAFMDVFAKAFKAAYEQVANQMKAQGG